MIGYIDACAGISGDMMLGALIDAGVGEEQLINGLKKLPVEGWNIKTSRVIKNGISALRVEVTATDKQPERKFSDILTLIDNSGLSEKARSTAHKVFRAIAEAEARIHAQPIEDIHFHEVGAVDSIIDIVGTITGFEILNVREVICSPVHLGRGFVDCQHGRIPVPAPATLEILKDIPVYSTGIKSELTTPTGAALVKIISGKFGAVPEMKISSIGYGAGNRDLSIPNVMRLYIGERTSRSCEIDVILSLEANFDDMNPEIFGYVSEKLFRAGALDVYLTPVQMKKNRPGVMLSVLTPSDLKDTMLNILFSETTTLGVRVQTIHRVKLVRESREINTSLGKIRIKIGSSGDRIYNIQPEYEDCRKIAEKKGIPLKQVYDKVKKEVAEKGLK